ncbi:MAG: hypothetical protein QM785_10185 [Pyrinomonadaceae bacterium]
MKLLFVLIPLASCIVFSSPNILGQERSLLARSAEYANALRQFQAKGNRRSVEGLIKKGKYVSAKIGEIESLSETDYSLLKRRMKGFHVNREEILFIEPELKYFLELSRKTGTAADIAYFTLMRKVKPDDIWTAYIQQQTDYSGCTVYGNGMLTKLYGEILKFRRSYPNSYADNIDEAKDEILEKFSENGCSCGDANGVMREFRLFVRTYPKDKNIPRIRTNLNQLKKPGSFRFNCHSG